MQDENNAHIYIFSFKINTLQVLRTTIKKTGYHITSLLMLQ